MLIALRVAIDQHAQVRVHYERAIFAARGLAIEAESVRVETNEFMAGLGAPSMWTFVDLQGAGYGDSAT